MDTLFMKDPTENVFRRARIKIQLKTGTTKSIFSLTTWENKSARKLAASGFGFASPIYFASMVTVKKKQKFAQTWLQLGAS